MAVEMGFQLLPLKPEEAASYHNLKGEFHKDPFDKMLIWQAISNNITLISKDNKVSRFREEGLKVIW